MTIITELNYSVEKFNIRMNQSEEESISELEDRDMEVIQTEQQ